MTYVLYRTSVQSSVCLTRLKLSATCLRGKLNTSASLFMTLSSTCWTSRLDSEFWGETLATSTFHTSLTSGKSVAYSHRHSIQLQLAYVCEEWRQSEQRAQIPHTARTIEGHGIRYSWSKVYTNDRPTPCGPYSKPSNICVEQLYFSAYGQLSPLILLQEVRLKVSVFYNNKCIGDDTIAAARQSLNCI